MEKKLNKIWGVCLLLIFCMIFGCTPVEVKPEKTPTAAPTPTAAQPSPQAQPSVPPSAEPVSPDVSRLKPNENGEIMILMYHNLGTKEEEWTRTYDNFRKDMNTMYEKGYRLISLKDFINNEINVPAGKTPFLLTFDDAPQSQFNLLVSGSKTSIDPNCAVGILEDMKRKHADFGKGGTFFVYYPIPFRQKEYIKEKFEFLVKNGYEIGNHSYTHDDLKKMTGDQIQKTLALNVFNTRQYLPDYDVFALALPYGQAPKGDDYKYVVSGQYQGTKYNHRAVLKVGWNPAVPPTHVKYDGSKLPRIRGSEMKTEGVGIYDWLKYFDKNPGKKYISDGNPDTVTVPKSEIPNVSQNGLKGKKLLSY